VRRSGTNRPARQGPRPPVPREQRRAVPCPQAQRASVSRAHPCRESSGERCNAVSPVPHRLRAPHFALSAVASDRAAGCGATHGATVPPCPCAGTLVTRPVYDVRSRGVCSGVRRVCSCIERSRAGPGRVDAVTTRAHPGRAVARNGAGAKAPAGGVVGVRARSGRRDRRRRGGAVTALAEHLRGMRPSLVDARSEPPPTAVRRPTCVRVPTTMRPPSPTCGRPPGQTAPAATVPVRPRSPALNRLLQLAALPTVLRAAAADARAHDAAPSQICSEPPVR